MDDEDLSADSTTAPALTGRRGALVGGLWNAAQMVLPMIGTTLLSIILGRMLGPDLLGQQSLISYSEALLAGVLVMSLQTASLQVMSAAHGARDSAGAEHAAWWGMAGQLLNGVVSATVLAAVGFGSDYPVAWYLAALTALVNAVGWGYATRVIASTGSWTSVASRRLWTQILAQLAAAVAVLAGAGLNAVFAANLVGAVLLLFIIRPLAGRLKPRAHGFPSAMVRLWGLFMLRAVLLQVVGQRIEFLFLAAYSTPDQIAMYSIPFMVVTAVVLIPSSIITAGMPAMAAREGAGQSREVAEHLGAAVRVTLAASVPLAVGLGTLGPRLIEVLYGSDFAEAGTLLAWMAPLVLVLPAAAVCETYWYGTASLRLPLTTATIAAVIDLVLCFALIPRFDALGAAWANLGGQGSAAIMIIVMTRRLRHTVTLPWGRLLANALAMGVVGAAAFWATQSFAGALGLALGILVGSAGALGFGRIVGFVGADDASWLSHTLPERLHVGMRWFGGRGSR